jgi:hypothetical protein
LYADSRGGLPGAFGFVALAQIESRTGRYVEATAALSKAEARLAKLEGSQNRLRADILGTRAEIAYSQREWANALRLAQQASAQHHGLDDGLNARFLVALSSLRIGKTAPRLAECDRLIRRLEQKDRVFAAASGRLMLAEALSENGEQNPARALAEPALGVFEPLENWEAIWRCRRLLLPASPAQAPGVKEALDRGRQILGVEAFEFSRKIPLFDRFLP